MGGQRAREPDSASVVVLDPPVAVLGSAARLSDRVPVLGMGSRAQEPVRGPGPRSLAAVGSPGSAGPAHLRGELARMRERRGDRLPLADRSMG